MAWALVSILALGRVGLVSEIDPATDPIQWPELGRQVAQEPRAAPERFESERVFGPAWI